MVFEEPISEIISSFSVEARIGGVTVSGILDRPTEHALEIVGTAPSLTVKSADIPVGTGHGTQVEIGFLQFKIKSLEPDGTGLTLIRLYEGPTMGGAFYRITAANLDIEEGWPDDITYYLTCVEDAYLMLPAKLDVSVLIAAGALEAVSASTPPSVLQLWYYRLGHATRDMDFAHDFENPEHEHGYYMTVPLKSVIGLPGWRNVQAMVSSGLLVPIDW